MKFKELLIKYNPYILIALPSLVAEILNITTALSGKYLVSEYLLKIPVGSYEMPLLGITLFGVLEIIYFLVIIYFLLPVFKVHQKPSAASEKEMIRAQTRVYNFPSFLIFSVWIESVLQNTILFFFKPEFFTLMPFLLTSIVSSVVTVLVIYYTSEFLNRFVLIPHWFPEGRIKVSWKFHVPSLFLRFGDTFLVSGILPMFAILGIIFLTMTDGVHDNQELQRLFYVCLSIGSVFWIIGALLTLLNSKTFLHPLRSMEKAIKDFGEGRFTSRVTVHSDDQIGVLEAAVNQMGKELEEKEIIKTVFGHYVSPAIRDMILEGKVNTEGNKIEAVVLFSDIRSFTSLSEKHPPENIVKLLNVHFTRIVDIVSRNDGFVDKFIGDAVMAVFDEELTNGRHKLYALRAAAAILSELEETNREIADFGFSPIKIGIGIASGPVIRGNIGSENRREMTVIGDTVNLASRLESATKEYGSPILVTETSFDQACSDFSSIRKISENSMSIRGKTELVKVLGLDLSRT